jgi:deazaflavin-dependent oxidoreductase (nitroreductase family)
LHRKLYLLSDGRVGAKLDGSPMALLHTIGRKSGATHTVPLVFYQIDPRGIIVLGSNTGSPKPPIWRPNLKANPEIDIQIGREKKRVRAEEI